MTINLYECKRRMDKEGVIFCFSGNISQSILVDVGSTLKVRIQEDSQSVTLTSKVFSIFVEQMQNMIHYSTQEPAVKDDQSLGIVIVGKTSNGYYISCGNMVDEQRKNIVEAKLLIIQKMDKDELKQYYKEQRKKGSEETSKGAGLGFIEMARKASQPIEFKIIPIKDGQYFFSLNVTI